jgi:hypothetical protein
MIWPYKPDKLKDFLNHLNSIHKCIQFTMETEKEGYLTLLDTDFIELTALWITECTTVSQSAALNDWTSSTLECLHLSIRIWSI